MGLFLSKVELVPARLIDIDTLGVGVCICTDDYVGLWDEDEDDG